jgi:restriction system protein
LQSEAPAVFERIIIALLFEMGYGGSHADAAEAIGKSGDEGLDGFIKKDRLGLDIIYVQAKRWAATVGRPEIQKFAGALHGQHSTKGISSPRRTFRGRRMNMSRRSPARSC